MSKENTEVSPSRRVKISQSDIPNLTLENALRIPTALWDHFAGKGTAPHNLALALDLSPTSGGWRNLCGASIAYGLTDGGYNAGNITLTELGRRVIAPTAEGDDEAALREAALKPRIPAEFFRRYDRAKFPREDIAANILVEMGLPKDRSSDLVGLLKENGTFVGFIRETKTGLFVALDGVSSKPASLEPLEEDDDNAGRANSHAADRTQLHKSVEGTMGDNNKVFITHGKNQNIVEQIKKLVTLGGFEPVVSTQRETAAKPVPDKVMDDMRLCGAAIIHVGSEGILTDADGAEHPQINPNVLIEIGAAMALYRRKYILVVEEGVKLPSNLQGLYESRYKGNSIELDAGMKILEALRGLGASEMRI